MRAAYVLLVLSVLVSGCVEDSAEPSDGSDDSVLGDGTGPDPTLPSLNENVTAVAPPAWNVTAVGCRILVASTPLLAGPARDVLPEGFEPQVFQGMPQTAGAALVVTRCDGSRSPLGEMPDHQEVMVYLYVDPPQEYRVAGIDLYRVMIRHGVANDELVAGYANSNITVDKASTKATTQGADTSRTMDARAMFDDLTFSFSGPVVDLDGSSAVTTYRVFTMADREVTGALDMELQGSTVLVGTSAYRVESGQLFGRPAGPALLVQYDTGSGDAYRLTPAVGPLTT